MDYQNLSRRPHNIKYKKVTSEIQETILDLKPIKITIVTYC